MKILFMGSIPTYQHGESREVSNQEMSFVRACEDMGYGAASRGHILVLGDDHIACADIHVANGAKRFATENPDQEVKIQLNRSEGSALVFDELPRNVSVQRHFHHEDESTTLTSGSLIPNLAALETSDILVILGGKLSAKLIGNIAADKDKPVLAIPSFGGSASSLFERLKYVYRNVLRDRYQDLSVLQTVWGEDSAGHIIDLCEVLGTNENVATPHGYFLSYNWDDSSYADHVEVLLHRKGRRVNRDEGIFGAGSDLTDVVRSLINDSDTFVALWSTNFKNSSWCPQELEYARQRRHKGEKPTRVIVLKIDDEEPPITTTNNIQIDGKSRELRELGVSKLIEQE